VASRVKDDLPAAQWAAAIQDGTLQGLVAARTLLAAGMRRGSAEELERAAEGAVRQIDVEIGALRALIAEVLNGDAMPDQVSSSPRPSA
jgi:hypothetical protein